MAQEEQGFLSARAAPALQDPVDLREVLRPPLRRAAQNQVQVRVPLAADVPLAPQEGLFILSHAAGGLTEEVTLVSTLTAVSASLMRVDPVLTETGSVSETRLLSSSAAPHRESSPGPIRAERTDAHTATAQSLGNQSSDRIQRKGISLTD